MSKNDWNGAFGVKFISSGGQIRAKENKVCLLWAASTTDAAANVTNASFNSLVPLQTILLACEPSERKSKETAAVLGSCSRNYGHPIYVYIVYCTKEYQPVEKDVVFFWLPEYCYFYF